MYLRFVASFLFLAVLKWRPVLHLCYCITSASVFKVCRVLRNAFLHDLVMTTRYVLLFPYNFKAVWLFSSDLRLQQVIFAQRAAAHWMFSFFPWTWLCTKILADKQFLKFSDQPVSHQQTWHAQSHLNHLSSPFLCSVWTSSHSLDHVYMLKLIKLLQSDLLTG